MLLRQPSIAALLSALALLAPPRPAANPAFFACDFWYPNTNCRDLSDSQLHVTCEALCPDHWAYVCRPDGHLLCVSAPT